MKREKLLFFFLAGLFLGVLLIQFVDDSLLKQNGLFSEDTIRRMKYIDINENSLFWYCLRKRGLLIAFLALLAWTSVVRQANYICCGIVGGWSGVLLASSCMRFGIAGPLLCLGVMFPQGLCYVFAYYLYLNWVEACEKSREKKIFGKMIQIFAMAGVVLIGILLESYVNPNLLCYMIKFLT